MPKRFWLTTEELAYLQTCHQIKESKQMEIITVKWNTALIKIVQIVNWLFRETG